MSDDTPQTALRPADVSGDSRLPTMKDVAERAGVSRQLVSMVLRGVAGPSEKSREKVLDAAAALDFQVNTSARLLRQSRTRLIGVMFIAGNSFESAFVERFIERADERRFGVVLAPMTPTRSTDVVISELLGHRVEALACFNPDPSSAVLARALDLMPVVWLGERTADARADAVRTDDDTGLGLVVEHLVALGHEHITFIGGLDGAVGPDRANSYRAAMAAAGLADRIDVVESSFDEEAVASAARSILARPELPTAIVASSDQGAAAVSAVLAHAGVDVPGDVSIVGYDDSPVAALSYNDFTSVRQDVELSVDETLAAIFRRIDDPAAVPADHATTATLVVRSSTGPARTTSLPGSSARRSS